MNTLPPYWERCFNDIDMGSIDYSRYRPSPTLREFLGRYLKRGSAVLDLGCGIGYTASYLSSVGFDVYGVDISQSALAICQKKFAEGRLRGTFNEGAFDAIPFPDNFFLAVLSLNALDHVTLESARCSLREMRRVLVEEGAIYLTFDPPDIEEESDIDAERLDDGTYDYVKGKFAGMLFHRYSDDEIRSIVGHDRLISFSHGSDGGRIAICR